MDAERLWAPWRLSYIQNQEPAAKPPSELDLLPGADPDCFICRSVADRDDRQNLVVHRGEQTVTILNRYPYNNGHLLIAPRLHQARLDELSREAQCESLEVITRWTKLLERLINAQGFNVGLNLGRVAGAGTPGHLHWHVVPRWAGDVNFMPAVAQTKVIPQSLDELWLVLTEGLTKHT